MKPETSAPKIPFQDAVSYASQAIIEEDIRAVIDVLKSPWLTQGPQVANFETQVAHYSGGLFATAVSSGTAALHIACLAVGLGKGDLLWTSPNTFVASANCALYCGADVDFVDIDPETKNINPALFAEKLKKAEKAGKLPKVLVIVHFAGHPCDMEPIYQLCKSRGIIVIEDATHALGSRYKTKKIGACEFSEMAVFSFHAIKNIATGEGGMIVTNRSDYHAKLQLLRTHGITRDARQFQSKDLGEGNWIYEQHDLGFNYRLTDIQCALGSSQFKRLDEFVAKRRQIVSWYNNLLSSLPLRLPVEKSYAFSAWHVYTPEVDEKRTSKTRKEVIEGLREANIGVNVHYIPVHLQPYYQKLGFRKGDFPNAELHYQHTFSLPLHTKLTEEAVAYIAQSLEKIFTR